MDSSNSRDTYIVTIMEVQSVSIYIVSIVEVQSVSISAARSADVTMYPFPQSTVWMWGRIPFHLQQCDRALTIQTKQAVYNRIKQKCRCQNQSGLSGTWIKGTSPVPEYSVAVQPMLLASTSVPI
jgi:hypothetical protein